jgi:tRNA(fMet)-specific endonuclease VapC
MLSEADLVLLDTSVIVDLARNNRSGQSILAAYSLKSRPDRPLVSVITFGEILGVAKVRKWAARRMQMLHELLAELVEIELGPEIVESYSDLVALCRSRNQTMGQQNDMWIAATARATGAVLLTEDLDFNWLHPHFIRVEYVPRQSN